MALLNFGLAMSLLGWGDAELYNVQCSILIIPVLYHVDASFTPPEVVTMCVSKLPNVLRRWGQNHSGLRIPGLNQMKHYGN